MPNYRRAWIPGGTYFFTVNLLERHNNDLLVRHIDHFKSVLRSVKNRHHFNIHAWVVLPDHMHCVIELPKDDFDYAMRWRLIKMEFSRAIPKNEKRSSVRMRRGERFSFLGIVWKFIQPVRG